MAVAKKSWNFVVLVLIVSCAVSAEENAENKPPPLPLERSSNAPDLMSMLKCSFDAQPVHCARENAGRMLDSWEDTLDSEMKSWGDAADAEVLSSGRKLSTNTEMPSEASQKLQLALNELANILQRSVSKSMARKKESGGGGVSSITITAGGDEDKKKKKKKDKKKKKPANIHIHQAENEKEEEEMDKGVLAEYPPAKTEGTMIHGLWVDQELAGPAKTRIKREQDEENVRDVEDGRGKKKKKKKAILKLLLLGAVLKAKIGLLLQLLSAHLQVKFFAIALAGLAINIARFWLDLKKGHQPQKVIYYEHAQHQHHYEHDDEHSGGGGGWGGYWSRSFNEGPVKTKEEEVYSTQPVEPSGHDDAPYAGWTGRNVNSRKVRRR